MLLSFFLLFPTASAIVDCIDGFVGRMQANIQDSFFVVNETRMCSAAFCIKVFVHSALDDDDVFQQGISSRCAYTGGDRQLCVTTNGGCTSKTHYDGLHGNFTLCCCQSLRCNAAMPSDLTSIYHSAHTKRNSPNSSSCIISLFLLSTIFLFFL